MKNLIKIFTALLIVSCFSFMFNIYTQNVKAGVVDEIIMNEQYDSSTLSRDNWLYYSNSGIKIESGEGSLKVNPTDANAKVISTSQYLGGKGLVMQFDIPAMDNFTKSDKYKWIGICFGATSNGFNMDYTANSNVIMFQNTDAGEQAIFYKQIRNGVGTTKYIGTLFDKNKFGEGISVKIEVSKDNEISLSSKKIEEIEYVKYVDKYLAEGIKPLEDGYAGISFNHPMQLTIDNLKVYSPENKENIFNCNFNEENKNFFISDTNSLKIDVIGEMLLEDIKPSKTVISKRPINKKEILPDDVFEFKFDIKFSQLKNKRIGLLFGLSSDINIVGDRGSYLYFENEKDITYFGVDYYNDKKEKVVLVEKTSLNYNVLANKKYINVSLDVLGSTIKIDVGGVKKEFNSDINGYWGFASQEIGDENNKEATCYIDNVKVFYKKYNSPINKDLAYNFNNKVLPTEKDAIIVTRPYNSFNAGNGSMKITENKLYFDRVAEGSKLLFNYKYSNFDLTFDLAWLQSEIEYGTDGITKKLPPSSFFGIMFNTNGSGSEFYSSNVNSIFINREIDAKTWEKKEASMNIFTMGNLAIDNNNSRGVNDYDFWDSTKNTIIENGKSRFKNTTIRLLVEDNIAKLYMRAEDESLNKLYNNPVYTFNNANSNGYVAIFGSGQSGVPIANKTPMECCYQQTNLAVDNVSIKNRDLIRGIADLEEDKKAENAITESEYNNYTPKYKLVNGSPIILILSICLPSVIMLFVGAVLIRRKIVNNEKKRNK